MEDEKRGSCIDTTDRRSPALTTEALRSLAERQAETEDVTSLLLASIYEDPKHATSDGLAKLTAQNKALVSTSNEEIMRGVASQIQLLEGLFHRYVWLAQNSQAKPAVVETYIRIALAAERVYLRAAAVLATLKTMSAPPGLNP